MTEPTCYCGEKCYKSHLNEDTDWLYDKNPKEHCWTFKGELHVWGDWDYYVHYCDGHGHPEDGLPYVTKEKYASISHLRYGGTGVSKEL